MLISPAAHSSKTLLYLLSSEPGLALDSARWVISLHTGAMPHQIHTVRRWVSLQVKRPTIVPLVPPNGGANGLYALWNRVLDKWWGEWGACTLHTHVCLVTQQTCEKIFSSDASHIDKALTSRAMCGTLHEPVWHVIREKGFARFSAWRVTLDCAMCVIFECRVTQIVLCVSHHSRNKVRTFPEWRVTLDWPMCATSLGKPFRTFPEWRVTHDCAVCDTSLKSCVPRHSRNLFRAISWVSYMTVQCVARHSGIMFRTFLSGVSHRIVQCVTRHSNHVWRVIRETFFVHFLSGVSCTIVQCVTRHSGIMFSLISWVSCHTLHNHLWHVTQEMLEACFSSDVTHTCLCNVQDTAFEKHASVISRVTCHTGLCEFLDAAKMEVLTK